MSTTKHQLTVRGTVYPFEITKLDKAQWLVTAPEVMSFVVEGPWLDAALKAAKQTLFEVYEQPYHEMQVGS